MVSRANELNIDPLPALRIYEMLRFNLKDDYRAAMDAAWLRGLYDDPNER